jgi:predicted O-methyltransferase YrrM
MLVLGDLRPLFAALEACPEGSILACREGNGRGWHGFDNLRHALCTVYGGHEADLRRLVGIPTDEDSYPLVVNDGLFAGSRSALLALDGMIRAMPAAAKWIDERQGISWRNQFIFNLVLARLRCGVELEPIYNVQLNSQDVQVSYDGGRMKALWYGQFVRVLHFNGLGRHKCAAWRNLFVCVPDPWVGSGDDNPYEAFLSAVQAWVGRYGLQGLAESLYGPAASLSNHVSAPSMLLSLAVLHYLIRAQGYVQVLEIGTAPGVVTACLASAMVHGPTGRIVTFDPVGAPQRTALWASLPEAMQARLELRQGDALVGLTAAREAGERYDAALLHALPIADDSWAAFQLAMQLVHPGGLLVVCTGRWKHGSDEQVLQRIAATGHILVRLVSLETDGPDEAPLGLVVIENRPPGWKKKGC